MSWKELAVNKNVISKTSITSVSGVTLIASKGLSFPATLGMKVPFAKYRYPTFCGEDVTPQDAEPVPMAATIDKAWRAFHQGDSDTAQRLFSELTTNDKASTHALVQHGLLLLRLDRFQEAAKNFATAADGAGENPAPLFFLALAQELGDQPDESKTSLEKLRAAEPHHQGISSLELLQNLRHGDPLPHLQKFGFGPERSDQSVSLLQRISASLGTGDPSWLPSDLSSSDYLLGPILIEVESRLHPLEVPVLEHKSTFFPDGMDKLEPKKRSFSEELKSLRSSLRAGPSLKRGKSALEKAFGLEDKGRQKELLKKALLNLRASRKLDPFGFRVSYHLGETYLFLAKVKSGQPYSRFRLQQAETSFLASGEREGLNPYLLFYLAYAQHLLGRPRLAIEYYDAATAKFEKLPEAHYGKGQCLLLLGDRQKAKELLLRAVNSDLTLARERLDTFADLLAEHGMEHFPQELPKMPPEPILQTEALDEADTTSQIEPQAEPTEASPTAEPNDLN